MLARDALTAQVVVAASFPFSFKSNSISIEIGPSNKLDRDPEFSQLGWVTSVDDVGYVTVPVHSNWTRTTIPLLALCAHGHVDCTHGSIAIVTQDGGLDGPRTAKSYEIINVRS